MAAYPRASQKIRRPNRCDAPRLTPAWVIHSRIHVRVEAILLRRGDVPRGARLLLHEVDLHDRLHALEPIFPRRDQPERRAVLCRKPLAVNARHHERERIHGLVHAQAFHVRPLENVVALERQLLRIEQRGEFDVLRLRGRLEALDEIGERKAHPRNDHRPRLDTAEAIDALFHRVRLEDVFYREGAFDLRLAGHRDVPRPRMQ
jgi:hypothetical protein